MEILTLPTKLVPHILALPLRLNSGSSPPTVYIIQPRHKFTTVPRLDLYPSHFSIFIPALQLSLVSPPVRRFLIIRVRAPTTGEYPSFSSYLIPIPRPGLSTCVVSNYLPHYLFPVSYHSPLYHVYRPSSLAHIPLCMSHHN